MPPLMPHVALTTFDHFIIRRFFFFFITAILFHLRSRSASSPPVCRFFMHAVDAWCQRGHKGSAACQPGVKAADAAAQRGGARHPVFARRHSFATAVTLCSFPLPLFFFLRPRHVAQHVRSMFRRRRQKHDARRSRRAIPPDVSPVPA